MVNKALPCSCRFKIHNNGRVVEAWQGSKEMGLHPLFLFNAVQPTTKTNTRSFMSKGSCVKVYLEPRH